MFVLHGRFSKNGLDLGRLATRLSEDGWRVKLPAANTLSASKGVPWPFEPLRWRSQTPRRLDLQVVEDTVTVSFAIGARRLSRETTLAEVASLLAHVPQLEHVERLSGLGRKVTQRLLGLTAAYLVVCVPIAFVLATIIKQNVADPLLIPTAHLSPTIAAGERIIAYLGPGHGAMVCEGRVVIRQVEGNPPIKISEWVLAEGPAVVHVSEDGAVRDGQPLTLPWNVGDNSDELTYTIPARSVLVGNRMSTGLYVLPVEEVNGVGVAVYYPLNRMRSLLDVGEANPQ